MRKQAKAYIVHQTEKGEKREPQVQFSEQLFLDLSPCLQVAQISVDAQRPGVAFNVFSIVQQPTC